MAVLGTGRQIASFSERFPDLTFAEAYRVTDAVGGLREARGERPVGRKIEFTKRTIWDEYGVHAPIWSFVYDRTVLDLAECGGAFALDGLAEPRIEPEIVFGLAAAPEPGVDAAGLLSAIAWVAPGFEIVQSIFPGWRFSPADTVIGFGLHGALLVGPRVAIGPVALETGPTGSRPSRSISTATARWPTGAGPRTCSTGRCSPSGTSSTCWPRTP
jgi:2-oxo-3-hexenedioate decarboxylase